jgi:hypothetical protein
VGPLLTNNRGVQEWAWILSQVGEAEALAAMGRLGRRRPYPLNIAKALGLSIPLELPTEPKPRVGLDNFERLRAILAGRK